MKLESARFVDKGAIPSEYTCDGRNIHPPLQWSDVPNNVKSFALIVDDPDAPSGTWIHWTIWNIDPSTREIPEAQVPNGASEGITGFGTPGYGGPCPPSGVHRYFFRLSALDIRLNLSHNASAQELREAIKEHQLAIAELVGTYQRRVIL
ncbi:MAG: YbhB/YbcL family Raf kinase inhibitor-like protein [Candidatus Kerfeldbacteria bacterium]|nr:YbhB/YbcL family Raf kinase inhibitor-like protein [Candidatus Kerfeldbacteria bacterium]